MLLYRADGAEGQTIGRTNGNAIDEMLLKNLVAGKGIAVASEEAFQGFATPKRSNLLSSSMASEKESPAFARKSGSRSRFADRIITSATR